MTVGVTSWRLAAGVSPTSPSPATITVAGCGLPSKAPPGAVTVTVGVAGTTSIIATRAAVVKSWGSAGVKATEIVWLAPAAGTVPSPGVYANVPGTLVVASSSAEVSGVP